jgi:gas vesicle protein
VATTTSLDYGSLVGGILGAGVSLYTSQESNKLQQQLASMRSQNDTLGTILNAQTQNQMLAIQAQRVASQNAVDAAQVRVIEAQAAMQQAQASEVLRNTAEMNKIQEELQRAIGEYEQMRVRNMRDQLAMEAEQRAVLAKHGVDPNTVLNPGSGNTLLVAGGLAAAGLVAFLLLRGD